MESGWISINDRLPEIDEDVLTATEDGYISIRSLIQPDHELADLFWEDAYGYYDEEEGITAVAYWMPIPLPPKEE